MLLWTPVRHGHLTFEIYRRKPPFIGVAKQGLPTLRRDSRLKRQEYTFSRPQIIFQAFQVSFTLNSASVHLRRTNSCGIELRRGLFGTFLKGPCPADT